MKYVQENANLDLYIERVDELRGPKRHLVVPELGGRDERLVRHILEGLSSMLQWDPDHDGGPDKVPMWVSHFDFEYSSPTRPERAREAGAKSCYLGDHPIAIIAVDCHVETAIAVRWEPVTGEAGKITWTSVVHSIETPQLRIRPEEAEDLALSVGRAVLRLILRPPFA